MNASANIAAHLPEIARTHPDHVAVVIPTEDCHYTFRELEDYSNFIAAKLLERGVKSGDRVALMVKPGLRFFAIAFAVWRIGAVIILIDPGMGIRGMGKCLREAAPAVFISGGLANFARWLLGWGKPSLRLHFNDSSFGDWEYHHYLNATNRWRKTQAPAPTLAEVQPDDMAGILFTSGSTGPAKGAVYTHRMFAEQIEVLRSVFGIQFGEVDLCTFPLFALFAPALGMTTIVPDMNPTRPAGADPDKLLKAVQRYRVTNLFGSPALIKKLARYCIDEAEITLPLLNRVISAGAPVAASVVDNAARMLAHDAQVFTPYGATESLPVAIIGSQEILRETRRKTDEGAGICVGRPVGSVEVAIIPIDDNAISDWSMVQPQANGQIGEIAVRGAVVSPSYFNRPDLTALAKIADRATNSFWHRMGDVGYRDDDGRLWFCGRKAHRVVTPERTYFTIPCEAVFNTWSENNLRTALVGVRGKPVMCVEVWGKCPPSRFPDYKQQLLEIGGRFEHTRAIRDILFYRHEFPVDIRHNAKINREKLALWAAGQLR